MRSSVISLAAALARLVAAQDNSSVPTINMFIDDKRLGNQSYASSNMFIDDKGDGNQSYAASIVCAGASETMYAMRCTDAGPGSSDVDWRICGPNADIFTLTANESTYIVTTATTYTVVAGYEGKGSVTEQCELRGTTDAICEATATIALDGTTYGMYSTTTWYGSMYRRFDVAITGGADKLAAATGECSSGAVGRGLKVGEGWALGTAVLAALLLG